MSLVRADNLQVLYRGEREMNCPECGAPMEREKEYGGCGAWMWVCTECDHTEFDEPDSDDWVDYAKG